MIDLHLHLDGSLSPALALDLLKEQGEDWPGTEQELAALLTAPETCQSLNDYLRCFDLPVRLLQSKEALYRAAFSLAESLAREGHFYAEIRFAPQLHTKRGLSQLDAAQAVCTALSRAADAFPGFFAQAIFCCMRGGEEDDNFETVRVAQKLYGQGVCALDLAGAEAVYETSRYQNVFSYARSLDLPFTIHAGEAAGPESVRCALSMGAGRIGHGVRSREDEALLRRLAEERIPLELCYTSNLQTHAVQSPEEFPLRDFLRRGVLVTLNTDNRTVSGVTLQGEYEKLHITEGERRQLFLNSVEAAFLSPQQKELLREKLQ